MDVADVAGIVVARDHDHRLALDAVQVLAREHVLVLEAVGREVAGDHDDVRLHLVDLGDGALEVLRQEELLPAMQVRQLHDPEHGPGTLEDPELVRIVSASDGVATVTLDGAPAPGLSGVSRL